MQMCGIKRDPQVTMLFINGSLKPDLFKLVHQWELTKCNVLNKLLFPSIIVSACTAYRQEKMSQTLYLTKTQTS